MQQKAFYGKIQPDDVAHGLIAEFDHGNMQAQTVGSGDRATVQIASRNFRSSGGQTGIVVIVDKVEDGVMVQLGDQQILGVAASLGATALSAIRNPLALIGRLDDLAQDITSLQLSDMIWQTIQRIADATDAGQQISDRLRRLECAYCGAAAPVGEPNCPACGAPLGKVQPKTCPHCGFVPSPGAVICLNCRNPL